MQLNSSSAVQEVLARFRRDLALGLAIKTILALGVIGVFTLRLFNAPTPDPALALLAAAGVWVVLSVVSLRNARVSAAAPMLIATGQFQEAERRIIDGLRRFSIFRATKLAHLHHLAMLRQAQGRWAEARSLCQALLRQRPSSGSGLVRSVRLMLAESALRSGDLAGAGDQIAWLYRMRLALHEAMTLLPTQLEFQAQTSDFTGMVSGIRSKIQLAELMPALPAMRVHGLLALAAGKLARDDWARWLSRRVELLGGSVAISPPNSSSRWQLAPIHLPGDLLDESGPD